MLLTSILGQNEETRAFYDAYQSNLVDDELMLQSEDVEMADADDIDEDDEPQETISAVDVEHMLRQAARQNQVRSAGLRRKCSANIVTWQPYRSIDPHDVSWLDHNGSDDETGPVPVKKISSKQLPVVRRRLAFDEEDEDRLEVCHVPLLMRHAFSNEFVYRTQCIKRKAKRIGAGCKLGRKSKASHAMWGLVDPRSGQLSLATVKQGPRVVGALYGLPR